MSLFKRAAGVLATVPQTQTINAKKAITTASAPTAIEVEVADRLIDYVEDESVLIGMARVERMDTNKKNLSFIDISAGLLRVGGCASDDSNCDTGTISGTQKILETKELKAVIPVCDNMLEDNIEGAALEDHVIRMAAAQIANELEVISLMASTTLPRYNSTLVDNNVEALFDGFYERMQVGGHILNGLSASDGRFITECKIQQLIQSIPTKYRKNLSKMKLFMPDDMKWDWVGRMKSRGTALGDLAITGQIPLNFADVGFVPVPLLPTNITSCFTGSASSNGTFMFLTDPDNLVYGIERNITFERERKGCQGRTFLIWTLRVDFLIENTDATALYDCMDAGGCVTCDCPS